MLKYSSISTYSLIKSHIQGLTRIMVLPSLRCPNEKLTKEPALFIFVISDGVVKFMAYSNLKCKNNKVMKKEKILRGQQIKACLQWERQAANPPCALKAEV